MPYTAVHRLRLAAASAAAIATLFAYAPAVSAQVCPYNSTQASCACPTSGGGTTCFGGQLYRSTDSSCQNDGRPCTAGQQWNCATEACECNTTDFPCAGCTAASSSPGASCGSPLNGEYTNSCGMCACPSGTTLCGASNTCVLNLVCPSGTVFDACTNSCGTPYVIRSPAWIQDGYIQIAGDIKSTGGDIYMANGKALRVDGSGATSLNIGNWGGGATGFSMNVFGSISGGEVCVNGDCRNAWPDGGGGGGGDAAYINVDGDAMTGDLNLTGASTDLFVAGNVGVGTTSPSTKLDVVGTAKMTGFTLSTGAGAGKVLTSDASGNGTWQDAAGGGGISGTVNYVPKFQTASTLGDSLIFDNGTNVGVGTASPTNKLDVSGTMRVTGHSAFGSTASVNANYTTTIADTLTGNYGLGMSNIIKPAPASGSASWFDAIYADVDTSSAGSTNFTSWLSGIEANVVIAHTGSTSQAYGVNGEVYRSSSSPTSEMAGVYGAASNGGSGTIANLYGLYSNLYFSNPANVTSAYGVRAYQSGTPTGGAVVTNNYGVYIDPVTVGTNPFALYSAGGKSYFAGNVGLGVTSPTQKLDIAGTAKMTGFQLTTGAVNGRVLTSDASGNGTWQDAAGGGGGVGGSGTTNYNAKWTAAGTIGDSIIYDNGTNVGVGTASPGVKLDVAGTTRMTGFALSTGAAAGRVLTSDASGNGTWVAPAGGGAVSSVSGSGAGITVSPTTGAVVVYNTGVTSATAGSGISLSGATGAVTFSNTGVTSLSAGSGISLSGSTGAITITNTSAGGITGSGSTNYVPKFTSGSSVGNSVMYDNGTNVGFSYTSPAYKIDVQGAIRASGQISSGGFTPNNGFGFSGQGTSGGGYFYDTDNGTSASIASGTYSLYGTGALYNSGTGQVTGAMGVNGSAPSAVTGLTTTGSTNGIYSTGGYYGINASSSGTNGYGGVLTNWGSGGTGVYGGGSTYGVRADGGSYGVYASGGYGVYASGSSYGVYAYSSNYQGINSYGYEVGGYFSTYGGTYANIATRYGYTLIGSGTLYNNGAVYGTSYNYISDRRTKQDVTPFKSGLETLMKIDPVNYIYNGRGDTLKGHKGVGVIAQDVREVAPFAVNSRKAKLDPDDAEDADIYSVEPSALLYVSINAIKEQQAQIEELKRQLKELEARLPQ